MPIPLTLPTLSWGHRSSERTALLVHGLGSNGALMWRYGVALAEAGWQATAVDLRGHGTAPRALDYSLSAYAADLAATVPSSGASWDLVIAHSLGGAAATLVAAADPAWTSRLVLIDPAIHLIDDDRDAVAQGQEESFADPSETAVRAAHPGWHEHDIELKATSTLQVSRWAVEQTSAQNPVWNVTEAALALTVPTHVIASDPDVYSIFAGKPAERITDNPAVTMSTVTGAGHSPHRDDPDATLGILFAALS